MSKMLAITDQGAVLASDPFSAEEFTNLMLTAQLNLFNTLVTQGADKAQLYDMYNEAASAFLTVFAPEIEKRPDLTAEAILEAENKLLAERAAKVSNFSPKQRKVEQLKNELYQSTSPAYDVYQEETVNAAHTSERLLPLNSLDEHGRPKKSVHKE